MALPEFTMRQLLEAGVHYGHQTAALEPQDGRVHLRRPQRHPHLDLTQTVPMLDQALKVVRDTVAKGGRILFVGTKRQAQKPVAEAAERCAQFYMNHRWLGGTLTNWKTVSAVDPAAEASDEVLGAGAEGLTKKERLNMERDQAKLQASLAASAKWAAPRT
jgi:small subunit ribosomal protein S2